MFSCSVSWGWKGGVHIFLDNQSQGAHLRMCVCGHVHFPLCTVDGRKSTNGVVSKRASRSGSIIKMHGGEFPTVPFIWGASLRQSQHALVMADTAVPGIIKGWSCDRVNPAEGLAQPATTTDKQAEMMLLQCCQRPGFGLWYQYWVLYLMTNTNMIPQKNHPTNKSRHTAEYHHKMFCWVAYVHSWPACTHVGNILYRAGQYKQDIVYTVCSAIDHPLP